MIMVSSFVLVTGFLTMQTHTAPSVFADYSSSSFLSLPSSSSSVMSSDASLSTSSAPARLTCGCFCNHPFLNVGHLCAEKAEAKTDKDKCDKVFAINPPANGTCRDLDGMKCVGYIPTSGEEVPNGKLQECAPVYKAS